MTVTNGFSKHDGQMVFDAQDGTKVSIPLLQLEKSVNAYNVTINFR
jgi:hypothetical protein